MEIKWFLNGALVKSDVLSFNFSNLGDGDIIKVEVINGTRVDSKTWNVVVKEKQIVKETGLDKFEIIYYVYISILLIVVFLIVRLFIIEKKKHHK